MKTIKGKCKNCGENYESGFFHDGKPAICLEEMGYCCMPCGIMGIIKRLNIIEKKLKLNKDKE